MQNTGIRSTGTVEPPFCDLQSHEKESFVSSGSLLRALE
jgi:hypothetical protein